MLVLGTRSSLFIPFSNLGLIIVDEEQDVFYKQDSPAPRYHARECAIMLASVCGANVILGSSTPSLEALHNARTGLFADITPSAKEESPYQVTVIDTSSERRKRGMVGEVSLKLLAEVRKVADSGGKVLVVSWSEEPELQGVTYTTPHAVKSMPTDEYSLIAVLQADSLLGRQDFRSDERTLQLLRHLNSSCSLVIQTKEAGHPVFQALAKATDGLYDNMMAERRTFGYPPFTRMVKLELKDSDENRQKLRARFLGNRIREVLRPFSDPLILGPEKGEIRVFFKRDKNLTAGKQALYKEVTSFEQQYSCHIIIDVDPV
jgi:primosomal protein N'